MPDSACKPGTQSRTQSIKVLLQSMPDPACKPVRTVPDARGNAMSSKTVSSRHALTRRLGASVRTQRRDLQRLGVSPMRRTTNNEPPGNSTYYYAYFPNEIFRRAIKGYLINVYDRKLSYPNILIPNNVGATLTPRSPSVTSDSSWIIIDNLDKQALSFKQRLNFEFIWDCISWC